MHRNIIVVVVIIMITVIKNMIMVDADGLPSAMRKEAVTPATRLRPRDFRVTPIRSIEVARSQSRCSCNRCLRTTTAIVKQMNQTVEDDQNQCSQ